MSDGTESGDGSRIYGFPNSAGRDRHIQNIIDYHANAPFPDIADPSFFPSPGYQTPLFNLPGGATEDGMFMNQLLDDQGDDLGLDNFGKLANKSNSWWDYLDCSSS